MQTLNTQCGEACFLVVRDDALSVCIARHEGAVPEIALDIQLGTRQPLGVGTAGLDLLSAISDRDRDAALKMNDYALPLYSGMTHDRLRQLAQATRERGWSVVDNHVTRNVLAVGLPVVEHTGDMVEGISVATLHKRLPTEQPRQIVQWMRQALRGREFLTD